MKSGPVGLALVATAALFVALVLSWSCSRGPDRPNVVLIVVDALRPDYLGCYGYDRPTSPNLDRLAAEGTLFETAVCQAPWTKPSFSTMLTSLYPFQHGVVDWESVMPDSIVTLPDVLQARGYKTAALVNMLGITGDFKVTRGFEVVSEATKRARDAAGTTDEAIAFIRQSSKPFFIAVHYFDVHWPRRPPAEYVELVSREGDPNPFAAVTADARQQGAPGPAAGSIEREKLLYAGCVRYVDDAIGRLLKFLDDEGLGRRTLVIVTADHGEAFWEHGSGSHGANLYDEAVRVPLIVRSPFGGGGSGEGAGGRVGDQVRHVDLLPTVVDYAGAPDAAHREGRSLRRLIDGSGEAVAGRVGEALGAGGKSAGRGKFVPDDIALSETRLRKTPETRSARSVSHKLILEPSTGRRELYDLRSDPAERVNIYEGAAAGADSLEHILVRVPGSSVNGWRVGFAGDGPRSGQPLEVTALAGAGGRITRVLTVTGSGDLALEVAPDSASLRITSRPDGLQIVLFDVEPEDAEVTFRVVCDREGGPAAIEVGEAARRPVGKPFTLSPQAAAGLPRSFEQARVSRALSAHVWWLPGDKVGTTGARITLTPESMRRLRSLGYVQ